MRTALLLLLAPLTGCLGMLDVLGFGSRYGYDSELQRDGNPEDDDIADKDPRYDPDLTVVETFGGCPVTLNKSGAVTRLDILPFQANEFFLDGTVFPTRAEALGTVDVLPGADQIPSIEVVNGALKPFNDGLYASVELSLQEGLDGLLQSKRQLLYDLLDDTLALADGTFGAQREALEAAAVHVAAGLLAGGNEVDLDPTLLGDAQARVDEFDQDPIFSRPIGFYTWDPTLQEVFRQDRFLQNLGDHESFASIAALAVVLESDPELLERYEQVHALYRGLTNPYASWSPLDLLAWVEGTASLDDPDALQDAFEEEHGEPFPCTMAWYALFPSSASKDTAFYNENFCGPGQPEGVEFMDLLIDAIESGELDLAPDADSGWYDYQLYALETLLLPDRGPESEHLLLTAAYKEKLAETFKSLVTQTRETHVKQLQMGMALAMEPMQDVDVYPYFPVEPFPTFYLRTGRAYRFLDLYLRGVLGEGVLEARGRMREDGSLSETSLAGELAAKIELTYGLYALSCAHLGMDPAEELLEEELAGIDVEASVGRARSWLDGWRTDPDVLADPRVIVPVAWDAMEQEGTYWAVLGVEAYKVGAEFVEGYEPEFVSAESCAIDGFVDHEYVILGEIFRELRIPGAPPTREEFRAICDQYRNVRDIVAALEGR